MRRIVVVGALTLAIFFIVTQPDKAQAVGSNTLEAVKSAGAGLARFIGSF